MLSLLIAGGVGCGNSNASSDAAPTGDSSADAPIVGPAIVVNQGVWTPNRDGNGEVLPTDFSQLPLQQWVTVGGSRNKLRDVEPLPPYPSGYGPSGARRLQIISISYALGIFFLRRRMLIKVSLSLPISLSLYRSERPTATVSA